MMGADHTSGPLHAFTRALTGAHIDGQWSMIHHLIRKTGHFFGYGVLSLAWLRAFMLRARPGEKWTRPHGARLVQLAAVAATFAVAGLDELHQSFVPNRTGKLSDVLLDTVGAVALQTALWVAGHLAAALETQPVIGATPAGTAAA